MGNRGSKQPTLEFGDSEFTSLKPTFQYPANYIRVLYKFKQNDNSTFSEYDYFLKQKCLRSLPSLKDYKDQEAERQFRKWLNAYLQKETGQTTNKGELSIPEDLKQFLENIYLATFPQVDDYASKNEIHPSLLAFGAFRQSVFELNCYHAAFFGRTLSKKILEQWHQEIQDIEETITKFNFIKFDTDYNKPKVDIKLSEIDFNNIEVLIAYMVSKLITYNESFSKKFDALLNNKYLVKKTVFEDLSASVLLYFIAFWREWKYRTLGVLELKLNSSQDAKYCENVISKISADGNLQKGVDDVLEKIKIKFDNRVWFLSNYWKRSSMKKKTIMGTTAAFSVIATILTKFFLSTPISGGGDTVDQTAEYTNPQTLENFMSNLYAAQAP